MKYAVMNRGDEISARLAKQFHQLVQNTSLILDEASPDLLLTIGGDGTLLQAFHQSVHALDQTAFVGIHTGHLGFYADWTPDQIETLAQLLTQTSDLSAKVVEYPTVEMVIESDQGTERCLALNECLVKTTAGTLVMQININDHPFEMFRGDGLCISTPSGSTGYNKSLNGAILHPSLETMQLTEMASINNRVYRTLGSPMVLPKHHSLTLLPQKSHAIHFSLDHLSFSREGVRSIRFRVATEKARFARLRQFPFWNRVREAFVGFESIK